MCVPSAFSVYLYIYIYIIFFTCIWTFVCNKLFIIIIIIIICTFGNLKIYCCPSPSNLRMPLHVVSFDIQQKKDDNQS